VCNDNKHEQNEGRNGFLLGVALVLGINGAIFGIADAYMADQAKAAMQRAAVQAGHAQFVVNPDTRDTEIEYYAD
jgi:proteasome assembly chaperone (PAC2) family protein